MTVNARMSGSLASATGTITIDLAQIAANWRALAAKVAPAQCAAVVKADAYGLGAERVIALLASGLVRTLKELRVAPAAVFHKTVHSSLYAKDAGGASLQDWLREHGIEGVIVCGIRTEQCCETTSRHASDAGFKVVFPTDATLTFAMQSPSGKHYTPAEIRDRTELVLQGRFARIARAADALTA